MELPELPRAVSEYWDTLNYKHEGLYTSEQMRGYALEAIAMALGDQKELNRLELVKALR